MFHLTRGKTALPALLTSAVLLGACNAPATPAEPRQGVEAADFEHPFRVVQDDDNDSVLTIERDGAEVWRIESFVVSAGPIADLTGDGRANVLIHEAATVSDRALHLLDLPTEGEVSVLWTLSGHASSFHRVESMAYQRVEAGESLAQPPHAAFGDEDGLDDQAFDQETLEALEALDSAGNAPPSGSPASYDLEQAGPDLRLAVSQNGRVIWQSDHTVIAHHGPVGPDGEGVSRLLVQEAVSRSVRRLQVLALEGGSVRSVWSQQGMAYEMLPRYQQISSALDAGTFNPAAFDAPGASEIDPHGFELPAQPGSDIGLSEAVEVDTAALEAAIAAMGYAILTGEDAEAQEMTIAVMRHGERVWGVRSMMMGDYSLTLSDTPGAVDLMVEMRETRRYGTIYQLRLAPDGLTLISETQAETTGFQLPRD
jgi:hypothetical protein